MSIFSEYSEYPDGFYTVEERLQIARGEMPHPLGVNYKKKYEDAKLKKALTQKEITEKIERCEKDIKKHKGLLETHKEIDNLENQVKDLERQGFSKLSREKKEDLIKVSANAGLLTKAENLSRSLSAEYKKMADEDEKSGYTMRAREHRESEKKLEINADYIKRGSCE